MLEQALQAARDQREQSQADLFELIRILENKVPALTLSGSV